MSIRQINRLEGGEALLRVNSVLNFVDVCPATWWAWVAAGQAPKGIKLSHKITVWKRSEIQAFVDKLATEGLGGGQ